MLPKMLTLTRSTAQLSEHLILNPSKRKCIEKFLILRDCLWKGEWVGQHLLVEFTLYVCTIL